MAYMSFKRIASINPITPLLSKSPGNLKHFKRQHNFVIKLIEPILKV